MRGEAIIKRVRVEIAGIVQGVGFRPYVYRLATSYRLTGWVQNTPAGVLLEAEGASGSVYGFLRRLAEEAPPLAVITDMAVSEIPQVNGEAFVILASGAGASQVQIAPDGDVCPDCLGELFDPADRRYRYPFITCTNCGPRYSIITGIPYDRQNTTMAGFPLCDACRAEYEEPANRRFHAQPNACPVCGPQLSLLDGGGRALPGDPLATAIGLLQDGRIVAVKGVGGFHLAVDACADTAVAELRRRKRRDEKPFALMVADLAEAATIARLDPLEGRLLSGVERPIVLLGKRPGNPIAPLVAPGNGYFGVMLPATPLQHLLMRDNFTALVMTSGNLSDEPIAYDDTEAVERLAGIADYFLTHNREIRTRSDDSVIRVFQGNPLFLRRSRGYVPRGITLSSPQPSVLAVGAELKAAICLTRGNQAFLSQHLGDLQNAATMEAFAETVSHLRQSLEISPELLAHDLHPDYLSTGYALAYGDLPKLAVQHHHAHMASCMAEHRLEGETIGVIFDGTGYGSDGTIWGGEFLLGDYQGFQRKGFLLPVPLPGGDAAVREPFRMALSHLYRLYGAALFELPLPFLDAIAVTERPIFLKALERQINAPLTSSCGRLFDTVAALLGLRSRIAYEGQAAIELEALAELTATDRVYPFAITAGEAGAILDFGPMLRELVEGVIAGAERSLLARAFHNTVTAAVAELCAIIRSGCRVNRVVLSGGVFQNKLLSEGVCSALVGRGFQVYSQRLAPPNDGGVALGQAVIAGRRLKCV